MTVFLIGILGLIVSTICFFNEWTNDRNPIWATIAWISFFAMAAYGIMEEDKKPPQTVAQLVDIEYARCINSYDPTRVIEQTKISREELCLKSTETYKQSILNTKPNLPKE